MGCSRLAPDCGKIELSSLRRVKEQERQLYTMGFETANVHVGTGDAVREVRRDLSARPGRRLRDSVASMLDATVKGLEAVGQEISVETVPGFNPPGAEVIRPLAGRGSIPRGRSRCRSSVYAYSAGIGARTPM